MNNLTLTIIGFIIIFASTTLGAALVFFFKRDIPGKINSVMLGFAAGVMIAASIWSLLIPSIDGASDYRLPWIPAAIGFIIGGLFLVFLDKVIPHFHSGTNTEEGPHSHFSKSMKLFLAVTIHNIPEGLAVGFAFGGAATIGTHAAFLSAFGLALGLAIQNFPEGAAVSLPMKVTTKSNWKSFLFGTASGAVEPVAAIAGYFLASHLVELQPWFLAFAAGAMIFVVAEDLIPDAKPYENTHLGTWGVMAGFVVMMILDVALG